MASFVCMTGSRFWHGLSQTISFERISVDKFINLRTCKRTTNKSRWLWSFQHYWHLPILNIAFVLFQIPKEVNSSISLLSTDIADTGNVTGPEKQEPCQGATNTVALKFCEYFGQHLRRFGNINTMVFGEVPKKDWLTQIGAIHVQQKKPQHGR